MKTQKAKRTVVVSILFAILITLSVFSGCGEKSPDPSNQKTPQPLIQLSLEKTGEIDSIHMTCKGGITYRSDDKYGVRSFDNKYDTGAVYAQVSEKGNYFEVTSSLPEDENDIAGFNHTGLIDATGREIIPMEYAAVSLESDRYAKVIKVDARTDSQENAVLFLRSSFGTIFPGESDPLYSGEWKLFDISAGKFLEGVGSTKSQSIYVYGNVFRYYPDGEHSLYVNENGEELPKNAMVFSNGCYILSIDDEHAVYDSTGNILFTYEPDGFVPQKNEEQYFICEKKDDDKTVYAVMDISGNIVSGEFDSSPQVSGNYLLLNDYLCDFNGKKILDDPYTSVYGDSIRQLGSFLSNGDKKLLLDSENNVVYENVQTDDLFFDSSDFLISLKKDDARFYYSWKDKDFTIEKANSLDEGLVKVLQEDYTYTLVDTVTGEELLSGYSDYKVGGNKTEGLFVYAKNKGSETFDIYQAK